jgi:sugar phosphate isomerase/epimerase
MFCDEIVPDLPRQLTGAACMGATHVTLRSGNVLGSADQPNIMTWDQHMLEEAKRQLGLHGLVVAEIGSPIGKDPLSDVVDEKMWETYKTNRVGHALDLAAFFGCRRLRGFSWYPDEGEGPDSPRYAIVVRRMRDITALCAARGVLFGCEVEANLFAQNGFLCAKLAKDVDNPYFRLVFDAGNLTCQNMLAHVVLEHFEAMLPYLGWLHIKDYRIDPSLVWTGRVDEDRLRNFVPADRGDSGHEAIFRRLRTALPALEADLLRIGIDGVLCTIEGHITGGGKRGGKSGPCSAGVAFRAFLRLLDYVGIQYELSTYEDSQMLRDMAL